MTEFYFNTTMWFLIVCVFAQALNRVSDSMGTLNHRTLLQYVDATDLAGLKVYLDSRPLPVDDRDEVCSKKWLMKLDFRSYIELY